MSPKTIIASRETMCGVVYHYQAGGILSDGLFEDSGGNTGRTGGAETGGGARIDADHAWAAAPAECANGARDGSGSEGIGRDSGNDRNFGRANCCWFDERGNRAIGADKRRCKGEPR